MEKKNTDFKRTLAMVGKGTAAGLIATGLVAAVCAPVLMLAQHLDGASNEEFLNGLACFGISNFVGWQILGMGINKHPLGGFKLGADAIDDIRASKAYREAKGKISALCNKTIVKVK